MRRWWKLLVGVGAIALLASLIFFLPPRDDGLDWVRKYGGNERELVDEARSIEAGQPDRKVEMLAFEFRDIPEDLLLEIKNRATQVVIEERDMISADLPGGRIITIVRRHNSVYVTSNREARWLERQWRAIKTRLGFY